MQRTPPLQEPCKGCHSLGDGRPLSEFSLASPPFYRSQRISAAAGGFPAGGGFTISSGSQIRDFPDVAYNLARIEYLVTWDLELSASGIDIWGKRLHGCGNTLTGGNNNPPVKDEFVIPGWPSFEAAPAVAACAAADAKNSAWCCIPAVVRGSCHRQDI